MAHQARTREDEKGVVLNGEDAAAIQWAAEQLELLGTEKHQEVAKRLRVLLDPPEEEDDTEDEDEG